MIVIFDFTRTLLIISSVLHDSCIGQQVRRHGACEAFGPCIASR